MSRVFRLPSARRRDPAIEAWFRGQPADLRKMARHWFAVMRACGGDVRETVHDDQPTACVGDAAFAYVDAFTAHVNVGFFHGADLADPAGLLDGAGKAMRHVTLRPGHTLDAHALTDLIAAAYADVKARVM